jgi:hypothetical protein
MKFFNIFKIGLGFWLLLAVLFWMLYLLQKSIDIHEGFEDAIFPSVQGNIKPIPSGSFSSTT